MNKDDIHAIRTPLIVLGVAFVCAIALVYGSGALADSAHRRLTDTEGQLRQVRTRIQNAGEEKEMIGRYLASYQRLEQAGFVGEEQRINWLEALRLANQQADIFGVDYDISAQRAYAQAAELNPGGLLLNQSAMRVKLRLLHEEDLRRFFETLRRQGGGVFTVDECVVRRIKPGEDTTSTRSVQPNLQAECELSWVTAKPPSKAEKKG